MIEVDPDWPIVGHSDNATFYEVQPRLLLVVPHEQACDDAATARQSLEIQLAHFAGRGQSGSTVISMDALADQTREAGVVYATEADPSWINAFALVSSTPVRTGSVFGLPGAA